MEKRKVYLSETKLSGVHFFHSFLFFFLRFQFNFLELERAVHCVTIKSKYIGAETLFYCLFFHIILSLRE